MWTDKAGLQTHTAPSVMTEADIAQAIAEYATAAKLTIKAGFEGIEIHAANGYLIGQFLNPNVNSVPMATVALMPAIASLWKWRRLVLLPLVLTKLAPGFRPTAFSTRRATSTVWKSSS
jgi:hypothetical protein